MCSCVVRSTTTAELGNIDLTQFPNERVCSGGVRSTELGNIDHMIHFPTIIASRKNSIMAGKKGEDQTRS